MPSSCNHSAAEGQAWSAHPQHTASRKQLIPLLWAARPSSGRLHQWSGPSAQAKLLPSLQSCLLLGLFGKRLRPLSSHDPTSGVAVTSSQGQRQATVSVFSPILSSHSSPSSPSWSKSPVPLLLQEALAPASRKKVLVSSSVQHRNLCQHCFLNHIHMFRSISFPRKQSWTVPPC